MVYSISDLPILLSIAQSAREDYLNACKKANKDPNLERLKSLDILDAAIDSIKQLNASNPKPSDLELQEACFGAYVFCFESIATKYKLSEPEFTEGYFYNAGSQLYKLLLKHLGINHGNKPDATQKLYYMAQYYNFVKKYKKINNERLDLKKLDMTTVLLQVRKVMETDYTLIDNKANKLLKAIPSEKAIDKKMKTMLDDYLNESPTLDRLYIAKIVTAVRRMIPFDEKAKLTHHFLSRSQRVKMGLLLYIMQSIWNEYTAPNYLRSPKDHSVLYNLCRKALNIESIEDIDVQTRNECFAAFKTFLTDNNNIATLEEMVNQLPDQKTTNENGADLPRMPLPIAIDPITIKINKDVDSMIDVHLKNKFINKVSRVTMGISAGCAILVGPAGYGLGHSLGYAVAQTNGTVEPKVATSKITGFAMSIILGDAGNYLGYFAANMVIESALERAFAKLFEALGMMTGAITGGVVGLVLVDLSYATLRSLCKLYMDLHSQLDPKVAQDFDPDFIQCLLALPEEIFTKKEKAKVEMLTQGTSNMFSSAGTGGKKKEVEEITGSNEIQATLETRQVKVCG